MNVGSIIGSIVGVFFGLWFVLKLSDIAKDKGYENTLFQKSVLWCGLSEILISIISSIFSFFNSDIFKLLRILGILLLIAITVLYFMVICNYDKLDAQSEKSRKIDTLLCNFLGFFGVHKFYERKIKSGIILAVISLISLIGFAVTATSWRFDDFMPIFAILLIVNVIRWLIDFGLILSGSGTDNKGNYIRRWNSKKSVEFTNLQNTQNSQEKESILQQLNNPNLANDEKIELVNKLQQFEAKKQ